jgi:phosphoserine phosphatase RsbU/P
VRDERKKTAPDAGVGLAEMVPLTQGRRVPDPAVPEGVPSILVVDDEPTTVAVLVRMLGAEGYRTWSAGDGATGRALAAAHQPELVLLDVNMPGESGFETCRLLKSAALTADTPILFLSADDDVRSKVIGFEAGAVDYVTKPFQREEVLARVRTHLRLRRAHRALLEMQGARLAQLANAQQSILPAPADHPEANFAVYYRPLQEAGGDFYDFQRVGERVFDFFVADVSGHDVGTSLATAGLKALLHQNAGLSEAPGDVLRATNRVIRSILPSTQYVTLVYLRVNRAARRLTLVSAGHPPALVLRPGEAPLQFAATGDVLGAFDEVSFDVCEMKCSPGDRVFLFSDGMIELGGSRADGLARLSELCARHRELPLPELVRVVPAELFQGQPAADDLVFLGVEV